MEDIETYGLEDELGDLMTEANNADLAAVAFAFFGVIMVICLIIGIITLIANWKIFRKMGEPGWKCLIPFYSTYTMYKHIWKGIYGLLVPLLSFASGVLFSVVTQSLPSNSSDVSQLGGAGIVMLILGFALLIVAMIISIIGTIKLAQAFGKGAGFVVGLLLFPTIFTLILGFGSDRYIGNPTELK